MLKTILCLLFPLLLSAQSTPGGLWYAVLEAGGQQLPLNIELVEADTAGWSGTLQSPAQSAARLPFSTVDIQGDTLLFEAVALSIQYRGHLAGDSLVGTFQQAAFSTPLTFYREPPVGYVTAPVATPLRPQDPTDFPYRREPVSFMGGTPEVSLAGELTLPQDTLPRALLILVSGSGPQDRNEDLGPQINHRSFLVLSDYLTRQGYGVLRYDDRGVGESTGDFGTATTTDFADDAAGAVAYLRGRVDLAGIPVGILGHSEGGMIGPMVAADSGLVDFLVLLAGPGIRIDSLMTAQRQALTGQVTPDEAMHQAAYAYLRAHPGQPDSGYTVGVREALTAAIPTLPDAMRTGIRDTTAFVTGYVDAYRSPWLRYFIAFTPGDYLEQVTVPVLAINGDLDKQVDVSNLSAIGTALDRAGNEDVTLVVAPGLNHLLQPAETGMPNEYGKIETTIDPGVLKEIGHWLGKRFVSPPAPLQGNRDH